MPTRESIIAWMVEEGCSQEEVETRMRIVDKYDGRKAKAAPVAPRHLFDEDDGSL